MNDEMNGMLDELKKWLNKNVVKKYQKELLEEAIKRV